MLIKMLMRCQAKGVVALLSLFWLSASYGEDSIAVVYPIVREPFASIYRDFIKGIGQGYHGDVSEIGLNGKLSAPGLKGNGGTENKAIVALGNKSLDAVSRLETGLPLFAAITKSSNGYELSGGILLEPAADIYLSRLLQIFPKTRKVHVVFDPNRGQNLIEHAGQYLAEHDVELNSIAASDIRESALAFRQIVKSAKSGDAVWLISDPKLVDGSLLSMILDAAWDKHLAVFSSNPVFVKRGALFAIYPDNLNIGLRLGNIVEETLSGKRSPGVLESLKDVKVAYNERTGNHIGVNLSSATRASIELFLPDI